MEIGLIFPPICQGGEAKQYTDNEHFILLSLMQDVDTAFLSKADLEANVDTLTQEIDFLKMLYTAVRAHPLRAIQGDHCVAWTPRGIHWTSVFANIWYHASFFPSNLYSLNADKQTSGEGKGSLTQVYESTPCWPIY